MIELTPTSSRVGDRLVSFRCVSPPYILTHNTFKSFQRYLGTAMEGRNLIPPLFSDCIIFLTVVLGNEFSDSCLRLTLKYLHFHPELPTNVGKTDAFNLRLGISYSAVLKKNTV